MKTKTSFAFFIAALVCGLAAPALAQDSMAGGGTYGRRGWGVGVDTMLTGGPLGAALVYDLGGLRAEGILSFGSAERLNVFGQRTDQSDLGLGGRMLWVLHQTGAADFSLGGGFGVLHFDGEGGNDDVTNFHVEALAQIRVFLVQNVALSTSLGFGVNLNDDRGDDFHFGGHFLTNAGLIYFFQ